MSFSHMNYSGFWRVRRLSWLLICCIGLGTLAACQLGRHFLQTRYYRISSTAIAAADLVGGTEIDTGRYVLLAYQLFSDVPHHSDVWYTKSVFVKLKSMEALPLGAAISIPNAAITVSAYSKSTWRFENSQHITGTITRLTATGAGQKLKLDLRCVDGKGIPQALLHKTLLFRNAPNYFREHQVDYHGKYEDLRIALKDPARVKSLDLITYAIQYEKRNGQGSGPDTLYQRLGELYNLEELNLNLSGLSTLPASISQLKRLKKLDLGYNHLATFPSLVLELDSLQELNLEHNQLDSIPTTIAQFKHLRVLNLDDNRLNHYPMSVNAVPGLQELGLSNANLRVIPYQVQQLTELRTLRLDGFWNNKRRNQLRDISSLSSLKKLRNLSLKDNGFSELPIGLPQLLTLEELNLQYNGLDSAKVKISRPPKLKKLML